MRSQFDGSPSDLHKIIVVMTVAAVLAVLVLVGATAIWQTQHVFPMPIHDDMFDRLKLYRTAASPISLLEYLISAHNEHRILTTRLIMILDEKFAGGREYIQIVATNLVQACCCVLAYRAVTTSQAEGAWSLTTKTLAFITFAISFINPNFLYTLIVPFQLQHAIMAFICLVAAVLMSNASDKHIDRLSGTRLLIALLALSIVGTFTLGNAPAILIAVAVTAVILRWHPAFIGLLSLLATAQTILVLLTTTSVGSRSYDFAAIVKFVLLYLGAPFFRFDPWPAPFVSYWSPPIDLTAAFGLLIVLAGVVFGLARLLRPGFGGRAGVFGLFILMIVVITGLAAATSRSQFGVLEASNKKYASFAALGLVGFLAISIGVALESVRLRPLTLPVLFSAFLLFLLPVSFLGYEREGRIWQKMVDRNWEAASAIFSKVGHRAALREIYTDEPSLVEYVGYIEPRGRSIFSRYTFRWGDSINDELGRRRETACRSEVQSLDQISPTDLTDVFHMPGKSMTMLGWTWMTTERAPSETVVAVDSSSRVVGIARTTRASSRSEEWLGQKISVDIGWFGYVRMIDSSALAFIALSHDGSTYCKLGSVGQVR